MDQRSWSDELEVGIFCYTQSVLKHKGEQMWTSCKYRHKSKGFKRSRVSQIPRWERWLRSLLGCQQDVTEFSENPNEIETMSVGCVWDTPLICQWLVMCPGSANLWIWYYTQYMYRLDFQIWIDEPFASNI